MQQKTAPNIGTFIILALIVVAALGLYFYYEGKPNGEAASGIELSNSPESIEAQAENAKTLSLLNEIRTLRIDDSIFSDPVYMSLIDYTIAIPELPVGRANPFSATSR